MDDARSIHYGEGLDRGGRQVGQDRLQSLRLRETLLNVECVASVAYKAAGERDLRYTLIRH